MYFKECKDIKLDKLHRGKYEYYCIVVITYICT